MNRRKLFFVLSTVLALSIGCTAGALAQTRDKIRLTSGDYQPMMSEKEPHHGFVSHIITEAFGLVGVEVEYGYFPWEKSFELAKEGEWDGSAAWWDRPERREGFFFSDPIAPSKVVFFHTKSSKLDWSTYEDLKDLTIGATEAYDYGKEFNKAKEAGIISVELAPTDEANLKKLLEGQIDAFIGDLMVTNEQIRDTFTADEVEQFTHSSKPVFEESVFLLLSKKIPDSEQVRERFNEGLAMLKESGKYDQIIADAEAGKYDVK